MREILERLAAGELSVPAALSALRGAGVSGPRDLHVDLDRDQRCGFPEVVFGEGKSLDQIVRALDAITAHSGRALVTRLPDEHAPALLARYPEARHEEVAHCLAVGGARRLRGDVAVLSAGTTDVPVAEEARVSAEMAGSRVHAHYDVGVAGLHRLLDIREEVRRARAVVVVAGMDGALPSVVAGLTSRPVIGVPTSVGYGTAWGGLGALLAMLNSCAPGLSVVNIDNGFGAGMLASRINLLPEDLDHEFEAER